MLSELPWGRSAPLFPPTRCPRGRSPPTLPAFWLNSDGSALFPSGVTGELGELGEPGEPGELGGMESPLRGTYGGVQAVKGERRWW